MPEPLPQFVARRRTRWERLDELVAGLRRKKLDLARIEELDRLYRSASADLATASTFYAGTDVAVHLNQLCARAYGALYRRRVHPLRALREFYGREFPALVWGERRSILLAAAIFASGLIAGAATALVDPSILAPLVGPEIVDSIERRTMWTDDLLSFIAPFAVSAHVLTNNIVVALACFAGGLLAGVTTATSLFVNGLHVGGITALCVRHGMALPFFGFVTAHGIAELSSLVIAGGAGFVIASAILVPGELKRADALRVRGRRAVRLAVGTAPLFAIIGMVEGFVSPGSLFPAGAKIALGLLLGTLLWIYLLRAGRGVAGAAAE